jgi:hypothetical protein
MIDQTVNDVFWLPHSGTLQSLAGGIINGILLTCTIFVDAEFL